MSETVRTSPNSELLSDQRIQQIWAGAFGLVGRRAVQGVITSQPEAATPPTEETHNEPTT